MLYPKYCLRRWSGWGQHKVAQPLAVTVARRADAPRRPARPLGYVPAVPRPSILTDDGHLEQTWANLTTPASPTRPWATSFCGISGTSSSEQVAHAWPTSPPPPLPRTPATCGDTGGSQLSPRRARPFWDTFGWKTILGNSLANHCLRECLDLQSIYWLINHYKPQWLYLYLP